MCVGLPRFWRKRQPAESGDYYYEKMRLINLRNLTGSQGGVGSY
jgi:hypothetical protein